MDGGAAGPQAGSGCCIRPLSSGGDRGAAVRDLGLSRKEVGAAGGGGHEARVVRAAIRDLGVPGKVVRGIRCLRLGAGWGGDKVTVRSRVTHLFASACPLSHATAAATAAGPSTQRDCTTFFSHTSFSSSQTGPRVTQATAEYAVTTSTAPASIRPAALLARTVAVAEPLQRLFLVHLLGLHLPPTSLRPSVQRWRSCVARLWT